MRLLYKNKCVPLQPQKWLLRWQNAINTLKKSSL